MALLDSEVLRIKAELGYNVLTIGALPYVAFFSIFDQVIQPYMSAGASTTSSTAVTATSGGSTTPVTLTLTSATGFTAGDLVIVDVDARQEEATIQALSGSTITVQLALTHSGSYPITVEGGETIIRRILKALRTAQDEIISSISTAGIKKADEVEFFATGSTTQLSEQYAAQMQLRDYMASVLGVQNMWRLKRGGANRTVVPC